MSDRFTKLMACFLLGSIFGMAIGNTRTLQLIYDRVKAMDAKLDRLVPPAEVAK